MIPATIPYVTYYEGQRPDGTPYKWTGSPVVAWDENGDALVAGDGSLERADRSRNFLGVRQDDAPVVAALPGAGWRAEYEIDDGTIYTVPVLAWLVRADGEVTPVDSDSGGLVMSITDMGNVKRIFHPHEEASDAKS